MPLPPDLRIEIEGAEARAKEAYLRGRFKEEATVTNYGKGYVSVPFVNQCIDLELQGYAADLVAHYYRNVKGVSFDRVVQVPNSGNPLATTVAERLGCHLSPGRKGEAIPGAWKNPIVVKEKVASFTTGERSTFVFNAVTSGNRVLLVDDVIALGETGVGIIRGFQERGIQAELAVYLPSFSSRGWNGLKRNAGLSLFT
jgi:adenine/guanine phosphoribosyltransferase-like PRPP-binding protein